MQRVSTCLVLVGALSSAGVLLAHAPSGAIFTTLPDGSEVNFNQYPSKDLVYLDGGPGPGAPQHAAALDDGEYVFQITDPSGKTLLSTDLAACRRFNVLDGVIQSVTPAGGCEHLMGNDVDHPPARTVQMMPFDDTPNHGGVYKAWVVRTDDFLAGCAELGVANGLAVVDCGHEPGNAHGFVPRHTKTDNFKVRASAVREIDTRFFNDRDDNGYPGEGEEWLDNLSVTWTDPLGGSNTKSSYLAPELNVFHEAHVEAIEDGTHYITIADQPGCLVGTVYVDGEPQPLSGPQTVAVPVSRRDKEITLFVYVACTVVP